MRATTTPMYFWHACTDNSTIQVYMSNGSKPTTLKCNVVNINRESGFQADDSSNFLFGQDTNSRYSIVFGVSARGYETSHARHNNCNICRGFSNATMKTLKIKPPPLLMVDNLFYSCSIIIYTIMNVGPTGDPLEIQSSLRRDHLNHEKSIVCNYVRGI